MTILLYETMKRGARRGGFLIDIWYAYFDLHRWLISLHTKGAMGLRAKVTQTSRLRLYKLRSPNLNTIIVTFQNL